MIILAFLNAFALLTIAGCVFGWTSAYGRRKVHEPILPYEPRKPVPWGAIDLLIAFCLLIVSQLAAVAAASAITGVEFSRTIEDSSPDASGTWLALFGIASMLCWAITLAAIHFRTGASVDDFGAATDQPLQRIHTGLGGFAMTAVPVLALQGALTSLFPSQHPLIEALQENPSAMFFLLGSFAAVIAAPISEEFLFRVILQGWLENLFAAMAKARNGSVPNGFVASYFWGLRQMRWVAASHVPPSNETTAIEPDLASATEHSWTAPNADAYTSPTIPTDLNTATDGIIAAESRSEINLQPSWWPIFISAILFAGAHWGHGPDPIPLFFLAVGLGYIYQRTHRVWPCILVHMLLNGVSMLVLWLSTSGLIEMS